MRRGLRHRKRHLLKTHYYRRFRAKKSSLDFLRQGVNRLKNLSLRLEAQRWTLNLHLNLEMEERHLLRSFRRRSQTFPAYLPYRPLELVRP